jgi:hypothetical protein
MNLGISFAPLVPDYVIWAGLAVVAVLVLLLFAARSRGAWMRAIALALMVLALANPSFTREDRDPIPSVVALVVDKSPSQDFGDRTRQTEAARAALAERLNRIPGLEVRTVEASEADGEHDGTRLFAALSSALADVPPDRVAGAIMITDGRIHDIPADAGALGFAAPLHALITGQPNERDRRVVLTKTFFLLHDFPGRFTQGQLWVEALPPDSEEDPQRPARAGDGVSSILITSNDMAGAWAMHQDGQPYLPMVSGEPRQREMAFRAGVNIVMYVLTGNYKADQVHIPALLERLGQ